MRLWMERMSTSAELAQVTGELSYWLEQVPDPEDSLPVDGETETNEEGSTAVVSRRLDQHETVALLREANGAYNTRVDELLLAAVARAFAAWTQRRRLHLTLEFHGRDALGDALDVSRTVGWFTSLFPVRLELNGKMDDLGGAIVDIKEQLRRIPHGGAGWGMLRYLSDKLDVARRLADTRPPDVSFNYLGQLDQFLPAESSMRLSTEMLASDRAPCNRRPHLVDINAFVTDSRMIFNWIYSHHRHAAATVERLADVVIEELRGVIAHCRSRESAVRTPSDFPLAGLSQKKLGKLARMLGGSKRR